MEVLLKTRVWAVIRNYPGITLSGMYKALDSERPSSIRRCVNQWEDTDVIYSKDSPKKFFTTFEKWEDVVSFLNQNKAEKQHMSKPVQQQTAPAFAINPNTEVKEIFERLTIPQGLQLYKQLHTIFGNVASQ